MYSVTARIQRGAVSPIVLTITPPFPIRFPSFRSHSRRLRRPSIAGHVARRQLSSRVSYKSFSAVAGPVWPEHPIRQLPFPHFRSRSAPPPANPQLLVSRSRIAGTQRITTSHHSPEYSRCPVQYIRLELPSLRQQVESPVHHMESIHSSISHISTLPLAREQL